MYELVTLFPVRDIHGQLVAVASTTLTGWTVAKDVATTLGPDSAYDLGVDPADGAIAGAFVGLITGLILAGAWQVYV